MGRKKGGGGTDPALIRIQIPPKSKISEEVTKYKWKILPIFSINWTNSLENANDEFFERTILFFEEKNFIFGGLNIFLLLFF